MTKHAVGDVYRDPARFADGPYGPRDPGSPPPGAPRPQGHYTVEFDPERGAFLVYPVAPAPAPAYADPAQDYAAPERSGSTGAVVATLLALWPATLFEMLVLPMLAGLSVAHDGAGSGEVAAMTAALLGAPVVATCGTIALFTLRGTARRWAVLAWGVALIMIWVVVAGVASGGGYPN